MRKELRLQILDQISKQTPKYLPRTEWLTNQSKGLQNLLTTGNLRAASKATLKEAKRLSIIDRDSPHYVSITKFTPFWEKNCEKFLGYTPAYMREGDPDPEEYLNILFVDNGVICEYSFTWDKAYSFLRKWGFTKSELSSVGIKNV